MTTSRYSQVEAAVRGAVEDALRSFSSSLAERGLSFQPPVVDVIVSDPSSYTSELRVYFVRGSNIVDAIEFHIFDHGKQMVQAIQVPDWMAEDLEDVINRSKR
jgi:hypothetical protein